MKSENDQIKTVPAKLCQSVACEAAVYEAAFGDVALQATAASTSTKHPRWRRAQFILQRILRVTLRLTGGIARRGHRRLHLCENLPLGERRFVAVVEFEQTRFLVGGTPSSLVLLARLENVPTEEVPGAREQQAAREKEKTLEERQDAHRVVARGTNQFPQARGVQA